MGSHSSMGFEDLIGIGMGYGGLADRERVMMAVCRRVLGRGLGRKRKIGEGRECKCFRRNVSVFANGGETVRDLRFGVCIYKKRSPL